MDFTINGYRKLLQQFLDRNYNFVDFPLVNPKKSHIVLRHDVDFCVKSALKMAEIEAEYAIKSHYFVLTRSEFYNPFSFKNTKMLQVILSLGHKIGLHLDLAGYDAHNDFDLEGLVDYECNLLENLLDIKVDLFSLHRPGAWIDKLPAIVSGRTQTYAKQFFKDIGYCSDSNGRWQYGEPLSRLDIKQNQALQLLIHPFWWVCSKDNAKQKLQLLLEEKHQELAGELKYHCKVFSE